MARPGLSPLRWGLSYILPEQEFNQLKNIDALLGTQQSMREVSLVETWPLLGEDAFKSAPPCRAIC